MPNPTKVNYKKTLNLPRTGFAMRANLAQAEPITSKRWRETGLYRQMLDARGDAPTYVFHDGPPYANGLIHTGHLLNKVLKDFVVRSRLLAGWTCPYVPGWDCHGLPIEHKVLTELKRKGKLDKLQALPDDTRRMAIRKACRADAEKYQRLQSDQIQRLLVLSDFDNPYLTMTPDYEKAVLDVFADLVEQGLVYRALKAVHWSIENQTALAEAELEYEDREDISVHVVFEMVDRDAVASAFGIELDETPSLMIWTTTPWTLPANLAIAVNQRFRYALLRVDGDVTVMASDLVDSVTQQGGAEEVEVLGETSGDRLVGLRYRHPFCDRESPVVSAEYVTLEDGTGLVHTAPGHGTEDNQTGLREGLDIYCPVRGDGTYDDTVPEWLRGMSIWDANDRVVEHLRESGHLFHSQRFRHSYPHDWRSKTPVIFRATEQWFVGVDRPLARDGRSLRELALATTAEETRFVPEWGRNRMRGMLESRPDWCISRQRSWGLPIPAFETPDGDVLLTPASVRAVATVLATAGSDVWFTHDPAQLLAGYDPANDPDAPDGVRNTPIESLSKMYDIFDVWFESGSSWHAVMRQHGRGYPTDLYLEGSDQHRGWFQLSLLQGLGATGLSPFRTLLTHGFIVDKHGRKMSKSLGNTIDATDLLKDFGAEVCRWWTSSLAYENDIKMDLAFLQVAGDSYRKVRNTLRFLLGNLSDYVPPPNVESATWSPNALETWLLAEAERLRVAVMEAYETFAFRRAHQLLYDFCNETLSAIYCAAVKDRLYCDIADSSRRRATQAAMHEVLGLLCRLLAPLLPHTADEAYAQMSSEDDTSVHLVVDQPVAPVSESADWPAVTAMRDLVLKAIETAKASGLDNPLDAGVTVGDPEGVLTPFAVDLADLCGVSRVDLDGSAPAGGVTVHDLRDTPRCERCWRRTTDTSTREGGAVLCNRCVEALAS